MTHERIMAMEDKIRELTGENEEAYRAMVELRLRLRDAELKILLIDKYAREDRMVTPKSTRLERGIEKAVAMVEVWNGKKFGAT